MNTQNKQSRKTINQPGVGKKRQKRYASTISRYKEAMKAGFYVEALALMESIMSDRMESLLNEITNSFKHSFRTSGTLAKSIKDKDLSEDWNRLMTDIFQWLNVRNHAIHELAKIRDEFPDTFEQDYANLQKMAEEGYELYRLLDDYIRKYRSTKKNKT